MIFLSNRRSGRSLVVRAAVATVLTASPALADNPKWGAHLDFEGRWGNTRSLGDAGLFAPLWQSQTSLFFADIRGRFDSQDGREGNFGLGIRHMLNNGWNLGAYGYYDVRRSGYGSMFNQATVGLEALSANWDVRANIYAPFGSRTRDAGLIGGGNPFADFANGTIQIVTPGSFQRLERALTGVDGEIGWRAPVFDVDALTQVRLYGGGFYFDGGGVTRDIAGPRGRVEFSIDGVAGFSSARLTLGAEVQHDDVRGTQGFAIARLRVPLQAEKAAPRLSAQERRMTERVVRDVDIVTGTGRGAQRAEMREAAVNTWNNQTVTTATQVTPVNQAALQAALDAHGAGSVVILNGAVTGATAATAVGANQTLIGGGTALALKGATTGAAVNFIAPGAAGAISGAVSDVGQFAGVVNLSARGVVGGLTISNTALDDYSSGILARGAPGAVAFGNTVRTVADRSFGVAIISSDNNIVSGNTIATLGDNSIGVVAGNTSHSIVSGNTVTSRGSGVVFEDTSRATLSNNTITSRSIGVDLYHFFDNGIVSGNRISTTESGSSGINATLSSAAIVSGNIFGPIGGDVIVTGLFPFAPGSTGNSVVGPVGGVRCGIDNTSSGTVYFNDGINCVFP